MTPTAFDSGRRQNGRTRNTDLVSAFVRAPFFQRYQFEQNGVDMVHYPMKEVGVAV